MENHDFLLPDYYKPELTKKLKPSTVVMFVDLSNSSLACAEPDNMFGNMFKLHRHFHNIAIRAVRKHDGYFVKSIGDEIMARFDYFDVKSEGDACCRAINAALEIQEKLKDSDPELFKAVFCKISINLVKDGYGIVVFDSDAGGNEEYYLATPRKCLDKLCCNNHVPESMTRDLLSPSVNVAARVAKIVNADQILVTQQVKKIVEEGNIKDLDCDLWSPTVIYGFKNMKDPVEVCLVSKRGQRTSGWRYPLEMLVRVTAKDESWLSFLERNENEALKNRCLWILQAKSPENDKWFYWVMLGGINLKELEDCIRAIYRVGEPETTNSIILRDRIESLNWPDWRENLRQDAQKGVLRGIWCFVFGNLGTDAYQTIKNRYARFTSIAKEWVKGWEIIFEDVQLTWGEYDLYVLWRIENKARDDDKAAIDVEPELRKKVEAVDNVKYVTSYFPCTLKWTKNEALWTPEVGQNDSQK